MSNHYHLLVQTTEWDLSRCMGQINGVYTQRYNRRNRHDGQLFRGRYKSILIDNDNYLTVLVRYIHHNPLRAEMVSRFELLTRVKLKRLREYKEFMNEEDSRILIFENTIS